MYRGIVDIMEVEEAIKNNVKTFILKASNNEPASWPNYNCVIWRGGRPIRVLRDNAYSTYIPESEIYLGHRPDASIPDWVPGVLSAVAQFFGINSDPEVRSAIIKMAVDLTVGIFHPLKRNLAETSGGLSLTHLAIHPENHLLAGKYPPENSEGPPIWRLTSGEKIDVEEPGWIKFAI